MNRPAYYKRLTYLLVLVLLSANQAVLASVAWNEYAEHIAFHNSAMTQAMDHQQSNGHEKSSSIDMNHDHQTHSDCDGSDNCNHCVNLVNSANHNNVHLLTELTPGRFAAYNDTFLPSDIRPPKHL